uniref:Uncharacterized protein n=1 Tax=Chromera velia CCMP2878 TaxID=1169474 RepID=A0A0G4GWR0_9ALVE|eukprot:Cvel_23713.t1-p1 / transcript=Cvel_23713.t1 / gene=Cvel_23713 / organism=Chromera_velia_CCMP2878 / gene_product=hypothetical protein / transcript_product=hypothetical protein / location=Cvel_scaffold2476:24381-26348(-) / protein_length=549 / sequence_SO=supercontig / SO=protein_coding / is_pseudo=false
MKDRRVFFDWRIRCRNTFVDVAVRGESRLPRRRARSVPSLPVSLRLTADGFRAPESECDGEVDSFVASASNVGSLIHKPHGNCPGRACFFKDSVRGCVKGWLCRACHYCTPLPAVPKVRAARNRQRHLAKKNRARRNTDPSGIGIETPTTLALCGLNRNFSYDPIAHSPSVCCLDVSNDPEALPGPVRVMGPAVCVPAMGRGREGSEDRAQFMEGRGAMSPGSRSLPAPLVFPDLPAAGHEWGCSGEETCRGERRPLTWEGRLPSGSTMTSLGTAEGQTNPRGLSASVHPQLHLLSSVGSQAALESLSTPLLSAADDNLRRERSSSIAAFSSHASQIRGMGGGFTGGRNRRDRSYSGSTVGHGSTVFLSSHLTHASASSTTGGMPFCFPFQSSRDHLQRRGDTGGGWRSETTTSHWIPRSFSDEKRRYGTGLAGVGEIWGVQPQQQPQPEQQTNTRGRHASSLLGRKNQEQQHQQQGEDKAEKEKEAQKLARTQQQQPCAAMQVQDGDSRAAVCLEQALREAASAEQGGDLIFPLVINRIDREASEGPQ